MANIRMEDMRIFAAVAAHGSFTAAGRALSLPKQTVSRRIATLERDLGVRLVHRTTRRLRLTEDGERYGQQCAELARLADEANADVRAHSQTARGTLRITTDPLIAELFLAPVLAEYALAHPAVSIELSASRTHEDLLGKGYDVAIRVGRLPDSTLVATRLGPARIRYCASPHYLATHPAPESASDLTDHDCITVGDVGEPTRWPLVGDQGPTAVLVQGRLRVDHLPTARAAAIAGLGVALFPAFYCADDIAHGRLVPVLDHLVPDTGAIHLVLPGHRLLAARVRAFVDLATLRLRSGLGQLDDRGPR